MARPAASGDPAETGEWNGPADYAAEGNALVENAVDRDLYRARLDGTWTQVG